MKTTTMMMCMRMLSSRAPQGSACVAGAIG